MRRRGIDDSLLLSALRAGLRALPPGLRGMLFMFLGTITGVCMHAIVRHMSESYHPFELAFFRNSLALLFLAIPLARIGIAPLRTRNPRLHLLRGLLTTCSMLAFFTALSMTPLAQVTALAFTAPLFATLLAIAFLGEVVRMRRWIAIVVGFAGTLVILRPGIVEFDLGSVLTVGFRGTLGGGDHHHARVGASRIEPHDHFLSRAVDDRVFLCSCNLCLDVA